ncbi:MAG: hypothetical protein ITF98_03845 [Fermentimonas sp.]|nr:hypothetical protein [Fermentimonas sp.]
MKKSILFSAIIGALLFMTSCLGEVSSNYSDTTFVYIDTDDMGTVYGKTISPMARVIISNEMMLMNPNRVNIMSYSWDEENGTKPITLSGQMFQADYVNLTGEVVDVNHTSLRMIEIPEVEEPLSFSDFADPLFASTADFMDDNWVFQYVYEVPKGQTASVQFFKRTPDNQTSSNVFIDVHLTHSGTATGTTVEKKTDFIALNMSALRNEYSNTNIEKLNIKFVFHLKDRTEPIESKEYIMNIKEN